MARRRSLAALVAALCWTAWPPLCQAAGPEALELDADAAVQAALRSNLDLQAERERVAMARGVLRQAGRLANPELELSMADDFAFGGDGERVGFVGFEQSFPMTRRLVREREVARSDVAIAAAQTQNVARGLIAEVLTAFYSLLGLERRVGLQDELVGSVQELEQATERRLRVAEVSAVDVSLLRIERLQLEQRVRQLRAEREVARLGLARLLGRSLETPIRAVGDLDPGEGVPAASELEDFASRRPDVRAAGRVVDRARADEALARSGVWADWRVRTWFENDRQVFDGSIGTKRDRFMGMGVVVPLPFWNRNEGRIAAASAELRRAQRVRDAVLLRAQEELRAVQARLAALRASAEVYRTAILPDSAKTRGLVERGYRQGLMRIADVIQAQRQDSEVRAAYVELLGELRAAGVEFEAVTASNARLRGLSDEEEEP